MEQHPKNKAQKQDRDFAQEYNEMLEKAREIYPNIEENIQSYYATLDEAQNVKDYLELSFQNAPEISDNQIKMNNL